MADRGLYEPPSPDSPGYISPGEEEEETRAVIYASPVVGAPVEYYTAPVDYSSPMDWGSSMYVQQARPARNLFNVVPVEVPEEESVQAPEQNMLTEMLTPIKKKKTKMEEEREVRVFNELAFGKLMFGKVRDPNYETPMHLRPRDIEREQLDAEEAAQAAADEANLAYAAANRFVPIEIADDPLPGQMPIFDISGASLSGLSTMSPIVGNANKAIKPKACYLPTVQGQKYGERIRRHPWAVTESPMWNYPEFEQKVVPAWKQMTTPQKYSVVFPGGWQYGHLSHPPSLNLGMDHWVRNPSPKAFLYTTPVLDEKSGNYVPPPGAVWVKKGEEPWLQVDDSMTE